MRARAATSADRSIFSDAPVGYPIGRHPIAGAWEVPVLAPVKETRVPEHLVAINDLGRATDPRTTGVHFFRDDAVFQSILRNPSTYAPKLSRFRVVLTPDITLGTGMNLWMKAQRVAYARMVGVVWERRGLCVVPTVRWTSLDDLDLVCSGIAPKTLIAVSNYGSRRDPELRSIFERGLPALVERLDPAAMLVFGDTRSRVFDTLRQSTRIVEYLTATATSVKGLRGRALAGCEPLFELADATT